MNKKLLLGLGGLTMAVMPSFAIVSCSDTVKANEVKFDVNVKSATKFALTDSNGETTITEANVYDAAFNENAKSLIQKFVDELTRAAVDYDFQKVLTSFYEIYENKTNSTEIEIDAISVEKRNSDGSFRLKVTVELEKKSRDKEERKTVYIDWIPKFTLISKSDVETIKNETNNFTVVKTNAGEIDLSDLKEIFLGERDEDDIDDLGIFDLLAKVNKNYENLGYLVAYELTLNDIMVPILEQLNKPVTYSIIDQNTKFYVPSLSINSAAMILLPNKKPEINIPSVQSNLTTTELENMIVKYPGLISSSDPTKFQELLSKLGIQSIAPEILSSIESIELKKDSKDLRYVLLITYKNSKQIPDAFVLSPSDKPITKPVVTPSNK